MILHKSAPQILKKYLTTVFNLALLDPRKHLSAHGRRNIAFGILTKMLDPYSLTDRQ